MLEAIATATAYVDGMDKAAFLADRKTQQAVVLNLVILGEAASRLMDGAPDYVTRFPNVPWKSMRGMRNRLAHGYFDINLDVVWDTLQHDLPTLNRQLQELSKTVSTP